MRTTIAMIFMLAISCADTNFTSTASTDQAPRSDDEAATKWELEFDADTGAQIYKASITGDPEPPVDYLFIVDNSSSMAKMISGLKKGFKKIATGNFPPNSKIAVMSTTVEAVPKKEAKLTGFQEPVTRQQILDSNREDKETAGCDDGWFNPDQKDGNDNFCLTVHADFKLTGTSAEAGLSAFDEYLDKHAGRAFREKAQVNVVFFSDTHDVGAGVDNKDKEEWISKLHTRLASYKYETFIEKSGDIDSLKFHGMVPQENQGKCYDAEGKNGSYSYNTFIDVSGGYKTHCGDKDEDDYRDFIEQMVSSSKKSNKIIRLPKNPIGDLVSVTVNGVDANYELSPSGETISLPNGYVDSGETVEVVLNYK